MRLLCLVTASVYQACLTLGAEAACHTRPRAHTQVMRSGPSRTKRVLRSVPRQLHRADRCAVWTNELPSCRPRQRCSEATTPGRRSNAEDEPPGRRVPSRIRGNGSWTAPRALRRGSLRAGCPLSATWACWMALCAVVYTRPGSTWAHPLPRHLEVAVVLRGLQRRRFAQTRLCGNASRSRVAVVSAVAPGRTPVPGNASRGSHGRREHSGGRCNASSRRRALAALVAAARGAARRLPASPRRRALAALVAVACGAAHVCARLRGNARLGPMAVAGAAASGQAHLRGNARLCAAHASRAWAQLRRALPPWHPSTTRGIASEPGTVRGRRAACSRLVIRFVVMACTVQRGPKSATHCWPGLAGRCSSRSQLRPHASRSNATARSSKERGNARAANCFLPYW
jgi:hypothetical protein